MIISLRFENQVTRTLNPQTTSPQIGENHCKSALRKLSKPRLPHSAPPPTLRIPDASSSLSAITPSTTETTAQTQLTQIPTVFEAYLKRGATSITPTNLLHFFRSRLRHHPSGRITTF